MLSRILSILLIATTLYVPATATADTRAYHGKVGEQRLGRYTFIKTGVEDVQLDILSVVISMKFPKKIKTVGVALNYLLRDSGYALATDRASCPSMIKVKQWTLPRVHREFRSTPLMEALLTLVGGETHYLVVDPIHRLISFEVKEEYKPLALHIPPIKIPKKKAL